MKQPAAAAVKAKGGRPGRAARSPSRASRPAPRRSNRAPKGRRKTKKGRSSLWWLLGAPVTLIVVALTGLSLWATRPGPGHGRLVSVTLPQGSIHSVSQLLQAQGLVDHAWLFTAYFSLLKSKLQFEPGEHLLLDSLTPRDLAAQVARLKNRPSVRVTLLEGWTHLDIAQRLQDSGVCSRSAFLDAVNDDVLLQSVGIQASSAEGYLFPDTYELLLDSSPEAVVVTLVQQAKKQLAELRRSYPKEAAALERIMGLPERQWITLASIIEKEAADSAELPIIASVFFNRLTDPGFRPERMLQSDPTAAYGCRVEPERASSCVGFQGKIVPAMLRDRHNRYNTYRHPGLPPGPISNPGRSALLSVLKPADTDYLFFFADGNGNHTFTRTFKEHREAIRLRQQR